MKRPKVVILTSRFPYPLTKGDKLRVFNHIKTLSRRFDLYVICLSESDPKKKDLQAVHKFCARVTVIVHPPERRKLQVFRYFLNEMPLQVRYFYSDSVKRQIESEIEWIHPDHIHVHLLRMAPFIQGLSSKRSISIDFMDNMSLNDLAGQYFRHPLLRWLKLRERKLIAKYEHAIASKYDSSFVISERDQLQFDPSLTARMLVVRNGVDHSFYHLPPETAKETHDLVFCGNLAYQPNKRAVYFILTQLLSRLSNIKLLIAGADLSVKVKKDFLQLFDKNNDGTNMLTLEGFREDLRTVYWSGKIMLAPIFNGSGQQNKVLEAMSCGVPCIATQFVNDGIRAEEGKELLVANNPEAFVSIIKNLLSHPERRNEIKIAARIFIERNFDWIVNSDVLAKSIAQAVRNE